MQPATVWIGVGVIVILLAGNLRGVRQAGAVFAVPTYAFIAAIAALVAAGLVHAAGHGFHPVPVRHLATVQAVNVLLVLRAFASGATAMTGIKAISNSVPSFKPTEWRKGAFGQICVIDRAFREPARVHTFPAGQLLSNSFSIDEHGGIYVATGALAPGRAGIMHKLVWTGKHLSADEADGAWTAGYPGGGWAPAVKVGTGTGSTPTLMGFGPGDDHLVIISDGQDRMHLTAFWRNNLPAGATSRIAGTIAVTCGLPSDVAWIQSEQSVATLDWGALVVNNVTTEGQADRLIDVLASGPLTTPAYGVERFDWDPARHAWRSAWTRPDLASISQVPVVSVASRAAAINTFGPHDGWEVTGVDWDTGGTVHRTVFGKITAGNGAYALVQALPDGDMIFTSVTGPVRVPLSRLNPKPIEPALARPGS